MTNAAMHIARTGLDAQDTRMRVISNNLANVNTTGFKRDRANFETLSYQVVTTPGAQSTAETRYATGLNLGTGVKVQGTARIDTQGSMQQTGNSLDLALDGDGYFQVQLPGGTLGYTRAGNFSRSAEGLLVTSEGYQVQPGITIPENATAITIGTDGTVSATIPGQNDPGRQLSQRHRPAGDRRQLPDRDRRVGRGQSGRPRPGWPRQGAPGIAGGVERQCRRGTGRHDRDAARL